MRQLSTSHQFWLTRVDADDEGSTKIIQRSGVVWSARRPFCELYTWRIFLDCAVYTRSHGNLGLSQ
jgi:hypothetical protein